MMPLTSLEVRKVEDRDRQHGDSMMAKFSLWVTNQVLAAQQGQKSRSKISSMSHWNTFRQRATYDHHLFINKVLLDYCHTHTFAYIYGCLHSVAARSVVIAII